eukprot:Skav204172  [mRNA]  locus=scaffold903:464307:469322:- [translate_table: standard]
MIYRTLAAAVARPQVAVALHASPRLPSLRSLFGRHARQPRGTKVDRGTVARTFWQISVNFKRNNSNPGVSAPMGSNPFAPAPVGQAATSRAGVPDETATGPMLGKGAGLEKVYYMPHNMGHNDGVNCMIMAEGKIFTGGRDEQLFVWRPERSPSGEMQLVQDCPAIHLGQSITSLCYEASSTWLFCGLWSGAIRAFCKQPVA